MRKFKYALLVFLFCAGFAIALSEQELIDMRDGFEARRDITLASQISDPYPMTHEVWWRQDFALSALYNNTRLAEANQAVIDACNYEKSNPAAYDESFHWRGNLFYRIYKFFYHGSEYFPGRLTPEAEDAIRDVFWHWAKYKSTISEADFSQTQTWAYWGSENHDAMKKTSCYSAADIFKDSPDYQNRIYDNGGRAIDHYNAWNAYFKEYISQRARKGLLLELGSYTYSKYTLQGWYNFYDFAPDSELRRLSGQLLDLWWTDWALDNLNAVRGGAKMRMYQDVTTSGTRDSAYSMAWYYINKGATAGKHPGVMCLATSGYRMPLAVLDIALDTAGKGVYEFYSRRPGLLASGTDEDGINGIDADTGAILRYTYHTPAYVLGTSMVARRPWTDWPGVSSQNRWIGAIFSTHANARIFPECVGLNNGKTYNQYWSVQNKGTLIAQKLVGQSKQSGDMRVFFSGSATNMTISEEGGWVFARMPNAFAAVRPAWGTYSWDDANWIRLSDHSSPVIMEVWQSSDFSNAFSLFKAEVFSRTVSVNSGVLMYTGLKDAGEFTFYTQSAELPRINGASINLAPNYTYQSPFLNSDWDGTLVTISKGDRVLELDFTYDMPQEAPKCYDLAADVNNDCVVDIQDLAIIAAQWMLCTTPGDVFCIDAR